MPRERRDADDPRFEKFLTRQHLPADDDSPESGDRWSTWDLSAAGERGPAPYPVWLVTALAAVDFELGVLKTGKEADVHLVERAVPQTGESCLLAAKRYRAAENRQFSRDSGYLEGRGTRRTRDARAIARRTEFGRGLVAGQWAAAEFAALHRLYLAGAPVPYPVQVLGTEVLIEFIGDADGGAAPRLAQLRPTDAELDSLWDQVVDGMMLLAREGLAHGDLSPYNILVQDGQVVFIDLPQVVDVVENPQGMGYLERDARNVASWFASRGVAADASALTAMLVAEAVG